MNENTLLTIILAPFFFVWWLLKQIYKTIKSLLEEVFNVMKGWLAKTIALFVLLFFIALIGQNFIK